MSTEFDKNCLPIWCQCGKQGYIFVDSIEQSYFVVCKECGGEIVEVFCPKCRAGSELTEVEGYPTSWVCTGCKTEYPFSEAFYQNPITLYLGDDLPDDVRLRVTPRLNANQNKLLALMGVLGFIGIYSMVIFGVADKFGVGFLIVLSMFALFVLIAVIERRMSSSKRLSYSDVARQSQIREREKAKVSIEFLTPLKPGACAKKLRRRITAPEFGRNRLPKLPKRGEVLGEVYKWVDIPFRFYVQKRRFILNAIAPQLNGRIYLTKDGTKIEARITYFGTIMYVVFPVLTLLLFFVSIAWVEEGFLSVLEMSKNPGLWVIITVIVLFLAIHFLIGTFETRYLKKFVLEIFDQAGT